MAKITFDYRKIEGCPEEVKIVIREISSILKASE
jgi:hypothetical protein